MSKHTALPWHLGVKEARHGIYDFMGHMICDASPFGKDEETKANAAFIVKVANCHDDLVAALQDAEFLMRQAGKIAGPMQDSFNRSAEDARAALAKAQQ